MGHRTDCLDPPSRGDHVGFIWDPVFALSVGILVNSPQRPTADSWLPMGSWPPLLYRPSWPLFEPSFCLLPGEVGTLCTCRVGCNQLPGDRYHLKPETLTVTFNLTLPHSNPKLSLELFYSFSRSIASLVTCKLRRVCGIRILSLIRLSPYQHFQSRVSV